MFIPASLESRSYRYDLCPVIDYMPKQVNFIRSRCFNNKYWHRGKQCTKFVYYILLKYVNLLFNLKIRIAEIFQQCP